MAVRGGGGRTNASIRRSPVRPEDRAARPVPPVDRVVVGEGPKAPRQWARDRKIDKFARDVAAGRIGAKRGDAILRGMRLTDAEKRRVAELAGRYGEEVQAGVGRHLVRGTANVLGSAVTLPLLGQTGEQTVDAIRGNIESLDDGPRFGGASSAAPGDGPIGGSNWLFPGSGLPRAGSRIWNNRRLKEIADEPEAVKEAVTPGQRVAQSLEGAAKARGKQEALRTPERGKRIGDALDAADEVGGEAGYAAATSRLAGELPRLRFDKLIDHYGEPGSEMRAVLQPQVDELFNTIRAAKLRGYEQLNTERALKHLLDGKVPTKAEVRLLGNVFGDEAKRHLRHKRALDNLIRVANIPRSMRATADLSFPFRQGLVMGTRHPRVWGRSWGPMLRAARSKGAYEAITDEIASRPTYQMMKDAKLALTDLGGVATREEPFISDLAETIPWGGHHVVRASTRAYTTFATKFRADLFDLMVEQAERAGKTLTRRDLEGLGSIINAGTGRGGMGFETLERAAPLLTLGLFSPRLIASRIAFLNPVYYYKLPPVARKEMREAFLTTVGAGLATLFLAKQIGAQVGDDPRSADFGKIRFGDSRIDIWGGHQQYVVNAYRFATKESVASTTGEIRTLEGGFAKPSRFDLIEDFLVGKAAPVPAWAIGSMKGKNFEGGEFNELREGAKQFVPLGFEGAVDAYRETGSVPATAGLFGLNFVGVGNQTYGAKPPKRRGSPRGSGGSRSLRRRGGSSKSLRRR